MLRRGMLVVALASFSPTLGVACVDGVTPDCSDAAAACGPDLDGGALPDAADGGSNLDATTDQ